MALAHSWFKKRFASKKMPSSSSFGFSVCTGLLDLPVSLCTIQSSDCMYVGCGAQPSPGCADQMLESTRDELCVGMDVEECAVMKCVVGNYDLLFHVGCTSAHACIADLYQLPDATCS